MKKTSEQLALPINVLINKFPSRLHYHDRLVSLVNSNLDFHDRESNYASHNFHSFPAKFPPQLPRKFIDGLTQPGDVVLDPMMGSGTTILEAFLSERQAMGFDIDPLALMITRVKYTSLDLERTDRRFQQVISQATDRLNNHRLTLVAELSKRWDDKTKDFVNYWFAPDTQIELLALLTEIEKISEPNIRSFLKVALSSTIITKTGGVSLALDLAHTRPHRAKIVLNQNKEEVLRDVGDKPIKHLDILTKTLRSPFVEFEKRFRNNLRGVSVDFPNSFSPIISWGDAQALPVSDSSVDLIVTSPPYATNAIDYMRAHKFSLIWFGHPVDELSKTRQDYIGGEATSGAELVDLPPEVKTVVQRLSNLDKKKSLALHRYYSELTRVIREMYRVIKPGKAAIVVVGNSIMRGIDTQTQDYLAAIGQQIGFEVLAIGVRNLDRNRRMLPAGTKINLDSQIQQRMHVEYVIGFYKPSE